jgi:hypothetical protein
MFHAIFDIFSIAVYDNLWILGFHLYKAIPYLQKRMAARQFSNKNGCEQIENYL